METRDSQPDLKVQSSASFVNSLINDLAELQPLNTAANEPDPPRTQRVLHEKHPQNPLSRLPASQLARAKPLMLTLHCLFPNDLLPALDILDRRLVHRLVRQDRANVLTIDADDNQTATPQESSTSTFAKESETGHAHAHAQNQDHHNPRTPHEDIFFVTSASTAPPPGTQPVPQHQVQDQMKGYEVRLHAWNCTCPTFTLSAFRDMQTRRLDIPTGNSPGSEMPRDQKGTNIYPFGGTLTCLTDRGSPPVCKHVLASVLFARCPGLFGGDGDRRCLVSMEELAGWCAGWGG
ncbi:hypothetical protein N7478_007974 [Penicillium angulare]|uniref:uncharacterized protein n=1 Tax=Penicillium angulare TaxID=116970 RepID=UPI00253FE31F|nr:uncharacterized protein N7478_007974 [Penicillium angulare]KAJ5272849.1 hypothetical protein N7478_007974 [Penicillium angulare]